jgi:hypothetical protein
MKTLYVRIRQKAVVEAFFRCAMKFSKAWRKVEDVDEATAKRLEAEQMLEVSETRPDDMEDDSAGDSASNVPVTGGSDTPAAAPADTADDSDTPAAAPADAAGESATVPDAPVKAKSKKTGK